MYYEMVLLIMICHYDKKNSVDNYSTWVGHYGYFDH